MTKVKIAVKENFLRSKKIIWLTVVFLLLMFAAGWSWWASGQQKAPRYLTVAAREGSIIEAVSAAGADPIEALRFE